MCPPRRSLSWKKRAWKVWCTGSQLLCLTLSPLEPSSLAKPPRSPCHLSTGQLPQAQVLSLIILGALDIVKIPLDAFSKLCRTWLILDSAFPKFVLSMRSLSDFILGPKTPFASSVYIFLTNKSPRKFSKWSHGILVFLLRFLLVKAIFNQSQRLPSAFEPLPILEFLPGRSHLSSLSVF